MVKGFFNKIRFRFFLTTKTILYTENYLKQVYKIYLNHDKVIHYRNGYPVFSLSTPAIFSKPAANMFARSIFGSIQNRNLPNLMSFAINDKCNANCSHCSFFTEVNDANRQILSLDQSRKLINDAQKLGVSVINFVGGEPLLRNDILEIIKCVDKTLSTTVMFTNGYRLYEMAHSLKKSGLDSVYVSIDSSKKEIHDKKRGKDGLFDKAVAGIMAAKKAGLSVGISCCINESDFKNGELGKIIELGKKMAVHEVLVFDVIPTGRLKNCHVLIDNNSWIDELINFSDKYNKDLNYPGVLIYAYSTSYRSTGCSGGTSYFYVSPYGDISPCDFNHQNFGNILEEPLFKIWDKLSSSDVFNKASWGGCRMKSSAFRKNNSNLS